MLSTSTFRDWRKNCWNPNNLARRVPFFRRIGVRLVLIMGAFVLVGTTLAATVAIHLAREEFFNVMERQFNSTFRLAENSLNVIGQMAWAWGRHLSTDEDLVRVLRSGYSPQLVSTIEGLRRDVRCDTLIVLSHTGQIIHHTAFPDSQGDSLMSWKIVRQAARGGKTAYGIIEEAGNFLVYGAGVTASKAGETPYIMLTGFRITDQLVADLSQETGLEMTFVRRTAIMASSLNVKKKRLVDSPIPYLDYQTLYNNPRLSKEVLLNGEEYYASVRQLTLLDPGMDGSLLMVYPRSALDAIIERLKQQYLWFYALGMIALILTIGLVSSRFMKPLRALSSRVDRIRSGDLSTERIEGGDEIAYIATSFNDLLGELATSKQKIEAHADQLEQQVAQRTRELREVNQELERQATHDALTGLPNRKLFYDRLAQTLFAAERTHVSLALLFIDLDRFKWVNDTFGHAAGDELLIEVSRRIQRCVREEDTVARLAGDEFTVILARAESIDAITEIAERLLHTLNAPFDLSGAPETQISGSIGIAIYPDHAEDMDSLLNNADEAMYRAKAGGRAAYRFWQPQ
jgi:diguanylate cyclase (GGDEF)-like protein